MDVNAQCICARLRKTSRIVTRAYEQALAPSGLKVTQYSLLRNIQKLEDQAAAARLVRVLRMDKTTLARNLDLLTRDGLVESLPGRDRRTKLLHLTPRGEAAVNRARPLWLAVQHRMADRLGQARLDRLFDDLAAFDPALDD